MDWFPTQLLLVPKEHMTQEELWASGDLLGRIGQLAVKLGSEKCPDGYRTVSNFGHDGLQSQMHGHVHLIGGKWLGLYVMGQRFRYGSLPGHASLRIRASLIGSISSGISISRNLKTRYVTTAAMAAPPRTSSG